MIPLEYPCCGNCSFLDVCKDSDSELDEFSWSWCSCWKGVTDGKN